MSSGSATRPRGTVLPSAATAVSGSNQLPCRSPSAAWACSPRSGQTALMRIPWWAWSMPMHWVKQRERRLGHAVEGVARARARPQHEAALTIAPPPWAARSGIAARLRRNGRLNVHADGQAQSASLVSVTVPRW